MDIGLIFCVSAVRATSPLPMSCVFWIPGRDSLIPCAVVVPVLSLRVAVFFAISCSPLVLTSCFMGPSAGSSGTSSRLFDIQILIFLRWYPSGWYPSAHSPSLSFLMHFPVAHDNSHILGCTLPQIFVLHHPSIPCRYRVSGCLLFLPC